MSLAGKLSPVAHDPKMHTWASKQQVFTTLRTWSTTSQRVPISASVGWIYLTKSSISLCKNKNMSFILRVDFDSHGYSQRELYSFEILASKSSSTSGLLFRISVKSDASVNAIKSFKGVDGLFYSKTSFCYFSLLLICQIGVLKISFSSEVLFDILDEEDYYFVVSWSDF